MPKLVTSFKEAWAALGVENRSVSIVLPPVDGYPYTIEFLGLSMDQQERMESWAHERSLCFRVQDYVRMTLSFFGPDPTRNVTNSRDGIVHRFCFKDDRAAFEFKMRWS
jgi:hypothetical protein